MSTASAASPVLSRSAKAGICACWPRHRWRKYLAYKGSITVNGVSLTVNRVKDTPQGCEISINLIPHTVENTALGALHVSAPSTWRST
jgi:riboflavin synthase alpha subunit